MTETAICDFENHGYYELVDVEDLKILRSNGKGMGQSLQLVVTKHNQKISHNEITIGLKL